MDAVGCVGRVALRPAPERALSRELWEDAGGMSWGREEQARPRGAQNNDQALLKEKGCQRSWGGMEYHSAVKSTS